jgi:pyruvate/2-oxoglutarate dehydrogenase complex dihydrolipoamide dehydrogenase (E3) component
MNDIRIHKHQVAVVGGGAAGLVVAFGAASAGIDVALIEAGRLGGECTWTGCVPSKTLIDAARRAYEARNSGHVGVTTSDVAVDFARLMRHIHDTSAHVAAEERSERAREAGITVYQSMARFVDPTTLALDGGERIRAKRFVLATGSRPHVPPPLRSVRHLTNETIWGLAELPEHLAVVGGGAMGTELAQAFRRLGSRVTIITDVDRLLPTAHPDASEVIGERLRKEGIALHSSTKVVSAAEGEHGIRLAVEDGTVITASHVLVTTGRTASLEPMNPAAASIDVDEEGAPMLDDRLRTSQKHIYVCGDAAGAGLAHIASAQGAAVLTNIVSPRALAVDTGIVRWAIFTDPEIAQVGMTKHEAMAKGMNIRTTRIPIDRVDRASVSGASDGFVEAVHTRSGKMLGVTIVGLHAAEWANQWIRPVSKASRLSELAFTETIYPTMGSSNAVIAFAWVENLLDKGMLGRLARLAGRARMWLARTP